MKLLFNLFLIVGTTSCTNLYKLELPEVEVNNLSGEVYETVDSLDFPARTVRFELQKIHDADHYDVVIESYDNRWKRPHVFTIDDEILRVRMTPGNYRAKTRSVGVDGKKGRWSQWFKFPIVYKAPQNVVPAPNAIIEPKGDVSERMTFEWPEQQKVRGYIFEIHKGDKQIYKKIVKGTWHVAEVPVDSEYKWAVTPLPMQKLKVEETPVKSFYSFKVGKPPAELNYISVKLERRLSVELYEFEFVKFISEHETTEPSLYSSREAMFRARLEPGEYELRGRLKYKTGEYTDWSPPSRIFIPFAKPILISPVEGRVIDPTHDKGAKVHLRWRHSLGASKYKVFVFDENKNQVLTHVVDTNEAVVRLPSDAKYYWQVQAYSPREPARTPAQVKDDTPSFKIDYFIKHDLADTEEPAPIYGWGKYIVSNVNYIGKNFDRNTLTNQTIFGGSGEIAMGYWHRKSRFGLLLQGDLSGFNIKSQNFTYWTTALSLGYRKIEPHGKRIRAWVGVTKKEMPELRTQAADDSIFDVDKLDSYGPHLAVSVMDQFNFDPKYGWHLYGSYYHALGYGSAPNGLEQTSTQAINFSAFITRRLSDDYKGMVGYSYRWEEAIYEADDLFGDYNSFSLWGHYLSFILEFDLEKYLIPKEDYDIGSFD